MKREEIIRDLVERLSGAGRGQYISIRCDVVREIVDLLKEQVARVMTLEEIRERAETADSDPVFVERKSGATAWNLYTIDIIYHMAKRPYMGVRVWTSRPTPEQMRDTKWEGESE